ncbi:MAG: DUF4363 family protein [Oscillospiraceae bacterium]
MKRVFAAFAILAIVITVAVFAQYFVDNKLLEIETMLNQLKSDISAEDYETVFDDTDTILQVFNKNKAVLMLFIRRDYIANADIALNGLSAYANKENAADLSSEVDKAAAQLKMIKDIY